MSERYCYACRRSELDCRCADREAEYAAAEEERRRAELEDWDAYCASMGFDHRGFGRAADTERARAEHERQLAERARYGGEDR
jgi:hypothetical protein